MPAMDSDLQSIPTLFKTPFRIVRNGLSVYNRKSVLIGVRTMAETLQPNTEVSSENYNYQSLIEELDRMNRELKEMKESVLKTSVRAHILEADLASLVNPDIAESLRKVQEDCSSCTLTMKLETLESTNR